MPTVISTEEILASLRKTLDNRKRLVAKAIDPTTRRQIDSDEEAQSNDSEPSTELG